MERYDYDPVRAERLLDEAGYPRARDGVRFHLTMKTSTFEDVRLLAAVLQQQLAKVGIALDQRSYEFATVPDLFAAMDRRQRTAGHLRLCLFDRAFFAERRESRALLECALGGSLDDAAANSDNDRRRADYVEAQQILARDLPAVNLWYMDTVVVHNRRLTNVQPTPSGSYAFLETAELTH